MDRRSLIKGIGAAICAGLTPRFVPSLLEEPLRGASVGYVFVDEHLMDALPYCGRPFAEMLNEYLPTSLLERKINETK